MEQQEEIIRLGTGVAQFVSIYEPMKSFLPDGKALYGLSFPASLVKTFDLSQVSLGKTLAADGTWDPRSLVNCRSQHRPPVEAWWGRGQFTKEIESDYWIAFKRELDILEARNMPRDNVFGRYPIEVAVAQYDYETPGGQKGKGFALRWVKVLKS